MKRAKQTLFLLAATTCVWAATQSQAEQQVSFRVQRGRLQAGVP